MTHFILILHTYPDTLKKQNYHSYDKSSIETKHVLIVGLFMDGFSNAPCHAASSGKIIREGWRAEAVGRRIYDGMPAATSLLAWRNWVKPLRPSVQKIVIRILRVLYGWSKSQPTSQFVERLHSVVNSASLNTRDIISSNICKFNKQITFLIYCSVYFTNSYSISKLHF
jgi:hypothetical protein